MERCTKLDHHHRLVRNGFSLVELMLSLAVLLIITVVAVPVIVRSLQSYQLNSAASQLSGMLKFTKFEAIRQNLPVSCQILQQGTNWLLWTDSNGDGQPDGAEPQMFLGGTFSLLSSGTVPDTSSIASALGQGSTGVPWTVLSAASAAEWFDHRGVLCFQSPTSLVCPAGPPTIYAIFVGNPNDPSSGYRAIITLPSGVVQVWSASSGGSWHRVS
jgi:prepilin-type N-terminal cleavage/methylation domain-containing protein